MTRLALRSRSEITGLALFLGGIICLSFENLPSLAGVEPYIRVLVANKEEVRLRADSYIPLSIKGLSNKQEKFKYIKLRSRFGELQIATNGSQITWKTLPSNIQLKIRSKDPRGVWLGQRRYRGELLVGLNGGKIRVINYINIEKYLASVVGSEMPKNWPIEALKAQSIASRTYALKKLIKNPIYDIKANEINQVYLGIEAETRPTKIAVRKTRSLVLLHQGKLINALFHSSSGGETERSGDVWRYQLPYLISVKDYDQNSPKYKWKMVFSSNELKDKFREVGEFNSIQVVESSKTGRVLKAKVYGDKGDIILSGKELRKRLNLKSTKVNFSINPYKNNTNGPVKSLFDNSTFDKYNNGFNVFQKEYLPPPLPSIPKEFILIVNGFGAGHGVGMSQWGAKSMADKGAGFRQILHHYYKGVKIRSFEF